MSKKILISPTLILALAAGMQPNVGFGYDVAIHDNMTSAAFNLAYSPATVPEFLGMLGIRPAQTFLGNSPRQWIIQGSKDEDNLALPRFHFLDPISDKGLNGTFGVFSYNFVSSPDWAFNTDGSNSLNSIPGARDSYYKALTNTDSIVREKQWRDTFLAVGHVAHLVQDMGQPQHVRNDIHVS